MANREYYQATTVDQTNEHVTSAQQHPARTETTTFNTGQAVRSGASAGTILGVIIGGSFWTHTPDVVHLWAALAIIIFCGIVGSLIGAMVARIEGE